MAENIDASVPDGFGEPSLTFGFPTPSGAVQVEDAADIPREIRQQMLANIRAAEGMPEEVRAIFIKALTGDDSLPDEAEAVPAEAGAATRENAPGGDHAPGCGCNDRVLANQHREEIWNLLDTAFPTDPHLWQAAEALFAISENNPQEIDDADRLEALSTASLHIERRSAIATPQISSMDQLIAAFREQMDR